METLEAILPKVLREKIMQLPNEYLIRILEEAVEQYELLKQERRTLKDPDADFLESAEEAFVSEEAKRIFEKFAKNYNPNRTFTNTVRI